MNICVYCFNETEAASERCGLCGQVVVDRVMFFRSVSLAELRKAREHWNGLDPVDCGGEQYKAQRLERFDAIIKELDEPDRNT